MTDEIMGRAPDGRAIYDNTATVVCLILQYGNNDAVVVVRRGHNPGKGKLGLPGGYQMYGETWQEAGAREAKEETGYDVDPASMSLISLETDEYQNNLAIALAQCDSTQRAAAVDGNEIEEIIILSDEGKPDEWAFPKHYAALQEFFADIKTHEPARIKPMRFLVPIADVKEGTKLIADNGFDCIAEGSILTVEMYNGDLCVRCDAGIHDLGGQVDDDGINYIGLKIAP